MITYRYAHQNVYKRIEVIFRKEKKRKEKKKKEKEDAEKITTLPLFLCSSAREVSACFPIDDKDIYFTSDNEGGF
jgi:hypothetical protein